MTEVFVKESAAPKFCKDCQWSKNLGVRWACGAPTVGSTIDVVDGERIYIDCHVARSKEALCGPRGLYWEERQ
jgi:hypothetical protein